MSDNDPSIFMLLIKNGRYWLLLREKVLYIYEMRESDCVNCDGLLDLAGASGTVSTKRNEAQPLRFDLLLLHLFSFLQPSLGENAIENTISSSSIPRSAMMRFFSFYYSLRRLILCCCDNRSEFAYEKL